MSRAVVVHQRKAGGFGVTSILYKSQALLVQWVKRVFSFL